MVCLSSYFIPISTMALNSSEWSNINSTKIIGYVASATLREGLRACLISFQLLSPVQVVTDCDGVRMEGSRTENSSAVSAPTSGNISDLIVDNWWLCQLCTVKGYHMSLWLLRYLPGRLDLLLSTHHGIRACGGDIRGRIKQGSILSMLSFS